MLEQQRKAQEIVRRYMWWSGGAGLIPIHYLDWAAVSGLQLKMLADISKVYGVPFQENLGKAAIGSLAGFVVPHAAAFTTIGSLFKGIPGLGTLVGAPAMAVFSGAYAWALGNMFILHFESGGTFLDFDPEKVREYFRTQFEGARNVPAPAAPGGKAS